MTIAILRKRRRRRWESAGGAYSSRGWGSVIDQCGYGAFLRSYGCGAEMTTFGGFPIIRRPRK